MRWCFFFYLNNRHFFFLYLYRGEATRWIIDLVWTRWRRPAASGLIDWREKRDGTFSIKMDFKYQVYVVFIMGVFKWILAHSEMKRNPFILSFHLKSYSIASLSSPMLAKNADKPVRKPSLLTLLWFCNDRETSRSTTLLSWPQIQFD